MRPLLCLLALLASACTAHRAGPAVKSVSFEGNDPGWFGFVAPQTDRALRNAMAHPKPARFSFLIPGRVEPAWLEPDTLDEDAWRVEVFYANHGYYDAKFLGWQLVERPGHRRLRPVRVVGYVEEGEPSLITSLKVEGLESLQGPTRRRLLDAVELAEGDVFDTEAWQTSVEAVRASLLERSYAFAQVFDQVDVYPDEHRVEATMRVMPGPPTRFGKVTITGLRDVPRHLVEEAIAVEEGRPFKASQLGATRSQLFGLRVFSVVNVVPDLSAPESGTVPVRVEVREAEATRELEAGVGVAVEPGLGSAFAEATVTDTNLFHRLWRGSLTLRPGAGVVLGSATGGANELFESAVRPVGLVDLSVTVPHVAGPAWTANADARAEVGMRPGYRFFSPQLTPSVTWEASRHLTVTGGWELTYFKYEFDEGFDLDVVEDSPLGLDVREEYFLSMLVQRVAWDGRNDPMYTTRGWYWSLAFGQTLGGDYRFVRGQGEVRAYRSIVDLFGVDPDTVVAGRLGAGLIVDYGGADSEVPHAERFYLGGGTTVRGWAADHLGPYVVVPSETAASGYELFPAGGDVQLYGNLELRQRAPLLPDLSIAAFTDVGRVWDRPANVDFRELLWSVGGGIRYRTPVGPVRLDVATRLGRPPYFEAGHGTGRYYDANGNGIWDHDGGALEPMIPAEPRVTFHFGLSEAF